MTADQRRPLALVPARGGSKRFPRKNVALLAGKPLLAWTLEAALGSKLFDEVFVSSEDEDVLRVAERHGGTPLSRPPELASDHTTVVQVCLDVVRDLRARGREYPALYVLLPTSPFRRSETIREAWDRFVSSGADALLSVVPLEHPPQWAMIESAGWLRPLDAVGWERPRPALPPAWRHDGGHAIAWTARFEEQREFLGPRTLAFPVHASEAVDVNEPRDLAWAEFLRARGEQIP